MVDLPDWTIGLSPGPAVGPVYGNTELFPDKTLTSAASLAVYFVNVAPGEHDMTFSPPPGKTMDCSHVDPFTSGWGRGWPSDEPNSVRVRVAPYTQIQVISVRCKVDPPNRQCPP